jgi:hypothetical protein
MRAVYLDFCMWPVWLALFRGSVREPRPAPVFRQSAARWCHLHQCPSDAHMAAGSVSGYPHIGDTCLSVRLSRKMGTSPDANSALLMPAMV